MTEEHRPTVPANSIEQRISIIGNSGSGKSTLVSQLFSLLNVPFVELDALN